MREAMFIKKNVEKWNRYQQEPPAGADETAERFTTLIDDLSYAKTYYPRSKVTRWINGLAADIYQDIYRNKKEKLSRVFDFWKYELPLIFKKYHRIFLFTTVAFLLFTAIGMWGQASDPDLIKGILGPKYVAMTEDNIAKGDPFGVYKSENQFTMFVRIALNNIRVSFLSFIGGFTLGFVTLSLMWSNGVMLGSFHYLFIQHGLGLKSVLVVWVHGTVEIFSIIIGSAAGFILANGILFPGTFSRLESFKRGIKDAAKVLLCLVPFFITASFLESYITHLMGRTFSSGDAGGLPVWASILILGLSFAFVIWYFVIWPIILHKRIQSAEKAGSFKRLLQPHE